MICEVCGGKIVDPDGAHRPSECIQVLKGNLEDRIQKAAKEAVKAERRRMGEAVETLPNKADVRKLLYPGEPAKPTKSRVIPFSELIIRQG